MHEWERQTERERKRESINHHAIISGMQCYATLFMMHSKAFKKNYVIVSRVYLRSRLDRRQKKKMKGRSFRIPDTRKAIKVNIYDRLLKNSGHSGHPGHWKNVQDLVLCGNLQFSQKRKKEKCFETYWFPSNWQCITWIEQQLYIVHAFELYIGISEQKKKPK